MNETPFERVIRLLKEEAGGLEFQQPWRTHRSAPEMLTLITVIKDGKATVATVADAMIDDDARAEIRKVAALLVVVAQPAPEIVEA